MLQILSLDLYCQIEWIKFIVSNCSRTHDLLLYLLFINHWYFQKRNEREVKYIFDVWMCAVCMQVCVLLNVSWDWIIWLCKLAIFWVYFNVKNLKKDWLNLNTNILINVCIEPTWALFSPKLTSRIMTGRLSYIIINLLARTTILSWLNPPLICV